jgi:alanine racemase
MIELSDLLLATGGRIHGSVSAERFADFAYDSRIVEPGQLFLALVTETGDGHDYVLDACRAGAGGVLCQYPPPDMWPGVTCVVVENTQQALLDYARYILKRRSIEVVGITGSVGKSSTKEAVAAVLGARYTVFRNYGSYNGRFGLPVALGKIEGHERLAVLEMAADSMDEIRDLADITRPQVGVVTAVSHSHLKFFGSLEAIAREKGRLVEALPAQGAAVLNHDDPYVRAMAARTGAHVLTWGLQPGADLYATHIEVCAGGTRLRAHFRGQEIPLFIPLLGTHHAHTALAAAAVGLHYGLSWDEITQGLARTEPLPGRTKLLEGVHGSRLLDDSYNANPLSALAALETARSLPAKRRLVLLGDMAELGPYAEEGHRVVGRSCASLCDVLITKGELARLAADEAIRQGMPPANTHVTYSAEDAVRLLHMLLQPGDLLLLKGSAEARLEFVTRELVGQPADALQWLPRQNRGWAQVRLERPGRPTWVEIDLQAIAHNVRRLVSWVGPAVKVMAVLKADGYGYGAIKVARTALNNGAAWLGVACLGEALALRRAGIAAPILILGFTPAWQAREAVLHDVAVTVFSSEVADALSRAAVDLGRLAQVHVKVDTGMGRLGLLPQHASGFVQSLQGLTGLHVDGIFTHMAAADDADLGYTRLQLAQFDEILSTLRDMGLLPQHIHAANSACLLRLPESHYNMVRPGIALYGLNPSSEAPCPPDMRPALAFKCQVAQVKDLPSGSFISYGRTFCTDRPSRIAVIPVGYADGFRRAPAHWGEVLVRGCRAPIVGRVCMDQTMIDVTDIPRVRQGDEVVLIGTQGHEAITVDQVAHQLGTVNYEVVSEILARVPRIV